jgi:NADH-quinone oxidoreductase subunit L
MFVISGALAIAGVLASWHFHLRHREALGRLSKALPSLVKVLEAKYWVDEIYNALFVKPLWLLGKVSDFFDLLVNAAVWVVSYAPKVGALVISKSTARGYLQGYAVVMLVGLAVILLVLFR